MAIDMLLDMVVSAAGPEVLVGARVDGITGDQLARYAAGAATQIMRHGARQVVFVGVNGRAVPILLFGASLSGVPYTPLNYRLAPAGLAELISRIVDPIFVGDKPFIPFLSDLPGSVGVYETEQWIELCAQTDADPHSDVNDDDVAVMLFTSGTTSAPKGVLIRHTQLVSYILQTVEFGAAEGQSALVSVPPYHIAGVGAVLSNLYAGRRIVYLSDFTPQAWLERVRSENITSAMLVPTMLARLVDHLAGESARVPTLRSIAYGGAQLPRTVLEKAVAAFPDVDFTNGYGLTETSSTIAVLGPDDHRAALTSSDPAVRARLGSVGKLVPGMEGQVRDDSGNVLGPQEPGELWVRGQQVSGEYSGGSVLDDEGWFPTRDRAYFDTDGYLFIAGRSDDTIIRGGENISPAEIEEVVRDHPAVADVAVFGTPDEQWGEKTVACVVLRVPVPNVEELRTWVRSRVRSSRTPDMIVVAEALPYSATGKLLRSELKGLLTWT